LEFVVEPVVTTKGVANGLKLNHGGGGGRPLLPVVNEFLDVFPMELPDMPPVRGIEFVIDLKPRTMPIYKSPYRMATPQLAELKGALRSY
jgi:hypothetical protein